MNTHQVSEAELQAYVDQQLPEERLVAVRSYLVAHPDEAERLAVYMEQKAALKACFDPLLAEPLPENFLRLADTPVALDTRKPGFLTRWSLDRMAAGLLMALLGGVGGWFAHAQLQSGAHLAQMVPLSRQAAVAHVVYSPDLRRPVELGADQEAQLIKWLSKRLGRAVQAPRLAVLGYELIGGRLLPGNSGPVAQFMYQDAGGQRLTIYVSTENLTPNSSGFRFSQEGAINVFYWIDGEFAYALSASIAKSELARVATAVYDQLENKPGGR